ncbi:MAG: multidrug efflux SMR transporter [Porticoccaceae bacterium]
MGYTYLAIAIITEVIATSALKASDGFRNLYPSLLVVAGYGTAFYFLSLTLKTIPVGVAYAIWAGMGIVLIAIAGAIFFRQVPDAAAIAGMALIISGVVVISALSRTAGH